MEKIKEIIDEYYEDANWGLFFTRNLVGDTMVTVYKDETVQIDVCFDYAYFEVFGLTKEQQEWLEEYYDSLED